MVEIDAGERFDVIVVGAGNAATCAALSARENGASVLMLEIAPEDQKRRQLGLYRRRLSRGLSRR